MWRRRKTSVLPMPPEIPGDRQHRRGAGFSGFLSSRLRKSICFLLLLLAFKKSTYAELAPRRAFAVSKVCPPLPKEWQLFMWLREALHSPKLSKDIISERAGPAFFDG